MLTIQLPTELEARLDALAKATGRTKTSHAVEAIAEYIGDLEDLYLAERRRSGAHAGETRAIPLDEMLKKHGLAD